MANSSSGTAVKRAERKDRDVGTDSVSEALRRRVWAAGN